MVIEEQHRVSAAGHRPTSTAVRGSSKRRCCDRLEPARLIQDYLGDAARFEQRGIKRDVALLGLAMFGKRDEKKVRCILVVLRPVVLHGRAVSG